MSDELSKPRSVAALVRRLLNRHRRAALVASLCSLLVAADVGLRPLLVGALVGGTTGEDTRQDLLNLTLVLAAVSLAGTLAEYGRMMATAQVAEGALLDLRVAVFDRELRHGAAKNRPTLGNAINDTSLAAQHLANSAPEALGSTLTIIATSVALCLIQPLVFLSVLVAMSAVFVPLTMWYRRRAPSVLEHFLRCYDAMTDSLRETAAGSHVAWRFGRPDQVDRFDSANLAEGRAYGRLCTLSARYTPSVSLLRGLALGIAIGATAVFVDPSQRIAVFAAYLVGLPTLLGAVEQLSRLIDGLTLGAAALGRLAQLEISLDPTWTSTTNEAAPSSRIQVTSLVRTLGEFSIGPLDTELTPGITAIVGATGAGKTTFARLVAGLDQPDSGAVDIDGQPPQAARESGNLVLLPQDVHLFPGTVLHNLLLANPTATRSDVDAMFRDAELADWLNSLPEGLDSVVDESLGDGDRHIISLGRVLLKNPQVLVLDEPTAGLDSLTGRRVERASARAFAGRIVLLVTHNLETAKHADNILVFDDGQLLDHGSHAELLSSCARYRELCGQRGPR